MQPPTDMDVWVLAGQSNMEGVGEISQASEPDPRVWCFSSAGQWEMAREPLHWFWESNTAVHRELARGGLPAEYQGWSDAQLAAKFRSERQFGVGPGSAFARMWAEHTQKNVGLIPTAHGATTLEQWNPQHKHLGGRSLYGSMLQRIEQAGGRLCGILWYQGESEGWNPAAAARYGETFAQWITAVRSDLKRDDLPIHIVQIGNTTLPIATPQAWCKVRLEQYALPERVPFVTVTATVDLPLVDVIHLNTSAQNRLGKRLARQALALQNKAGFERSMSLGPRIEAVEKISIPKGVFKQEIVGAARIRFRGVTGKWNPSEQMLGFEIRMTDGSPTDANAIYHAHRDEHDPTAIFLHCNLPLQPGQCITYGWGLNPACNVVDEADMPLCAFSLPM